MICTPPSSSAWCSAPLSTQRDSLLFFTSPPLSSPPTAALCKAVPTPVASLPCLPPVLQTSANWPPSSPLPGSLPPSCSFGGSRSGFPRGSVTGRECHPFLPGSQRSGHLNPLRSRGHVFPPMLCFLLCLEYSSFCPLSFSLAYSSFPPRSQLRSHCPPLPGWVSPPWVPVAAGPLPAEEGPGCRVLTPAWNPALCLPGPAASTNSLASRRLSFRAVRGTSDISLCAVVRNE